MLQFLKNRIAINGFDVGHLKEGERSEDLQFAVENSEFGKI